MEETWYQQSPESVSLNFQSDLKKGLTELQVKDRLEKIGTNELQEAHLRPLWLRYFDQFKSVLIVILFIAAGLAFVVGEIKDSVVILLVVIFNTTLGFYQEYRAEQTLLVLKGMLSDRTTVRREGVVQEINSIFLVPGDIVLLDAGDKVPADGRVTLAHDLEVLEASLTGESLPIGKKAQSILTDNVPLAERSNMLFMNTVITRGRAEMIVTAAGERSEMGKIAGMMISSPESKTPLQEQLDHLGKKLALIAGSVVLVILGINYFRDISFIEAAMSAIALAVAAVPEGLPAVVTVTLAIGMWRMAKNKAILKKLSAVETLGSTTVICSDKTGTLTQNKMTARQLILDGQKISLSREQALEGVDLKHLYPLVLCSEAGLRHGEAVGEPTEKALLNLAITFGLEPEGLRKKYPRIGEIPFDSQHKFMATFHHDGKEVVMLIKGAPDILLHYSSSYFSEDSDAHTSKAKNDLIEVENMSLAKDGLRVIGMAHRKISIDDFDPSDDPWKWVGEWTFLGMVGLMDPPRPEAKGAIELCQRAGIEVKMITGDHKVTAQSIARELGLQGDVILGSQLDEMTLEELSKRSGEFSVFARVSPEHKVKILQALKMQGHVTAMTGDGVNDAPALKTADIGVAMGMSGSDVTKEAATLILTDDNFATIVRAVKEGRVIYENIIKFVRFQLSTNIGAILIVLTALILGFSTPFTPAQLLWINIIMDGPPAMTLGLERPGSELMEFPPRHRHQKILTGQRLAGLCFFGVIMMIGTLWIYFFGLTISGKIYARTLAFTTFVFFQFFNVFNAREEFSTSFSRRFFTNWKLWSALGGIILLQVLVVYWGPAQELFRTRPIELNHWPVIVFTSMSVLAFEELRKFIVKKKRNSLR